MQRRILQFSLAVFLGACPLNFGQGAGKDRGAETDLDKIMGTWQIAEAVGNGKKIDVKISLVFAADKLSISGHAFPFKLKEKTKPKSIDIIVTEGVAVMGIFRFEGDMLQICAPNVSNSKVRPKEFAAPADSGMLLLTLKKR